MARGLSITSVRKKYPQLQLMTDKELAEMHNSGRAKRDEDFVYGINKEKEAREKERLIEGVSKLQK